MLETPVFITKTLKWNGTNFVNSTKTVFSLPAPIYKNKFFLRAHFWKTEFYISDNNIKIKQNITAPSFYYKKIFRPSYQGVDENERLLLVVSGSECRDTPNNSGKKHRIKPQIYNTSSLFSKNSIQILFPEKASSNGFFILDKDSQWSYRWKIMIENIYPKRN